MVETQERKTVYTVESGNESATVTAVVLCFFMLVILAIGLYFVSINNPARLPDTNLTPNSSTQSSTPNINVLPSSQPAPNVNVMPPSSPNNINVSPSNQPAPSTSAPNTNGSTSTSPSQPQQDSSDSSK